MDIKLNDNITNIVNRMLDLYKNRLANDNINASRTLSDTASTTININGLTLSVYFNLEHYWKYVEYGRRPGKRPPIKPIEDWIKIKPVVPNPINGVVPSTKQLAFLISRKIGMEGTKPQHPLEKSTGFKSGNRPSDMNMLINELKHDIVNQVQEQLNKLIENK